MAARADWLRRGLGSAVVAAALAMPKARPRLGLPRWLALAVLAGGPAGAAAALPRGRLRSYATFMAHMWAYYRAFELTYAQPEKLARRLRVGYPIAVDRVLGGGRTPTQRLQAWRRRSRAGPAADRVLGAVYLVWALERQAVLLWLLWRHPGRFGRSAALVAAAFDVGWLIYSAVPTAPPWWAAKHDRLPGVQRVTVEVTRDFPLVPEQSEADSDQGNPWASFPSTHAASAAMVAIVAADQDRAAGVAASGYAAALGLALVYLGEHYLVDVLAGAALALSIRAAAPRPRYG